MIDDAAVGVVLAVGATLGQVFESGMLVCFGVSWPVAILKTWRSKRTEGKSMGFLVLVFIGYLSGVAAKFSRAAAGHWPEPVTILYAINAALVMTDLLLVRHYRRIGSD